MVIPSEDGGSDDFPLGRRPSIGPESTVNPFECEPLLMSPLEILKTVILLPVFVLRVCILALALIFSYCFVKLALIGVTDPLHKPFSRWRRAPLWVLRICLRIAIFTFGFYWVSVKGKPASRKIAPIIVSNHISFLDPVYIFYSHMPVIVSAKENVNLPFVGVFLKALQIIPVDRTLPMSRKDASAQIRRRAIDNRWPHIMLFPEGTTTNGKALISFKTGAFAPGLPVQPMVVRYPHKKVSPAWVDRSLPLLMFRLMTQFINFMEVEYLPVMEPTARELKEPRQFSERVRKAMANALGVPCTEHTFLDVKLAMSARKYEESAGKCLVEFGNMEKLFQIDFKSAEEYLKKFSEMDITHSGVLHVDEFVKALNLPLTPYTAKVFNLFDKSGRGYINFREFVAGLAFVSKHTSFEATMKSAFEACDVDGDGVLSRKEVEMGLVTTFPELLNDALTSSLTSLFEKLDMDEDGVISWKEFKTFLQTNPEYLAVVMAAYPSLLHNKQL